MLNILYNEVFNSDGSVKPCGRDVCKFLISYLSDKYPDVDFGNTDTGYMNIENIKKYASQGV